ncbi:hypothetical protein [Streptomyces radiopugnans]|uniref:Uncharacterized protein n=1 Tax=Streptomyces radiopugnans TaxID=403935 RepID=A0A1H9KAG4_9ACTN|nr:hypothetical protein [Streptomyces radiopugnans]SEQ96121.1 hypothetical protein SAMN05216481_12215 [Streptomyces radiopugnans]
MLDAPETRHLLLDRMTGGQRAAARKLVAQALTDDRPDPGRLAWRLEQSLVGKGIDDIRDPFAWLRHHLKRRGCRPDCPCGRTDCERGLLWPSLKPCESCEEESAMRLAQWRLEHTQAPQDPPSSAPQGPVVPDLPRERPAAVVRRLPIVPAQPDPVADGEMPAEPVEAPPVTDLSDYVQKTAPIRQAILAAKTNARRFNRNREECRHPLSCWRSSRQHLTEAATSASGP